MKSLDRAVKRDRKKRYRAIKKLFKARDAASKYLKTDMLVSFLLRMIGEQSVRYMSITSLAKFIVEYGDLWLNKPPAPPSQRSHTKPSMTKLPKDYPGPLRKKEPEPPRNTKPSITKLEPNPPKGPEPVIGHRR